jgi:dextranase
MVIKMKRKSMLVSGVMAVMIGASFLSGCSKENPVVSESIESGNALADIQTDKAIYKPGDQVSFSLSLNKELDDTKLNVVYKHLNKTISEQEIDINGKKEVSWNWNTPKEDYQGYMVEILLNKGKEPIDHINIGVDVSSDWSKFPRYGYLADFYEMEKAEQEMVIKRLNRFHINGIQFYDWQYKHEKPLKMENGQPATSWPDIANREVSKQTVENYIELAHEKNMKAMNYNLLFGAYDNAEQEGVSKEWGLFKDPFHEEQDMHPLPENWASDIHLYDPSNPEWQDFLLKSEKEVFDHLKFDGFHVDQLGDRGTVWNYQGDKVELAATYAPFLQKAKEELGVPLVMNAVSQFAQMYLATQAPVDFLYAELWDGHPSYQHLKDVIDQNNNFSKGKFNTVLAAYMNYDLSNSIGKFNAPGVLLTNSVIFASGGSHIELGENMLSKEYFPHKKLEITKELNEQLIKYYDFMVAYQNLLRDNVTEKDISVNSENGLEISEKPEQGKVWSFAKVKDGQDIVHLINFKDANSMEWRDNEGTQPEPKLQKEVTVSIAADKKVENVWMASPDLYNGSAIDLKFKQKDGQVSVKLPSLKYWNMIVLDFKK